MAGVVHIPWYATVFRGDELATALGEAAPIALRYGATAYSVHRSRDDTYRLLQMVWFEDKADWQRYWDGPEMIAFRARWSGRYQVPLLYVWNDEIATGSLAAAASLAAGNGGAAG
jgi:hypothetical protein